MDDIHIDTYIRHADNVQFQSTTAQVDSADVVNVHTENVDVTTGSANVEADKAKVTAEHARLRTEAAYVRARDAQVQAVKVDVKATIGKVQANDAQIVAEQAQILSSESYVTTGTARVEATKATVIAEVVMLQTNKPQLTALQKGLLVSEFTAEVRRRTAKQVRGSVIDSYKRQKLNEPGKEYTPQLKEIDFYGGDLAKDKEYRRGQEFKVGAKELGDYVDLESIFVFSPEERVKAIVGPTGSGKTTLMKRIVRDVMNGSKKLIKKMEGESAEIKEPFFYFLNIRDIPVSEEITPCDLLFGKVLAELDEDALEHGFKWLRKNQKKAVFFFDGLDQATWSLQGDFNPIRYEDKASTSTIMKNLLEGNLFPNVLIIISSREHALSPLTGNLRPHEIIGLAGFTMEDRKQVFIGLAGEDGENLWNLMCTKSPALVPLASIPIFLVFIVIVYKFDPDNLPDTMSGIMTKILQIFLQSDHARERKNIMEILEGLKQMSFKGTKEGRVLFTHNDLKEFSLSSADVRDLVIRVPGSTILGQNLMEEDYKLFFCHQSIQELLSALHIVQMAFEDFEQFVLNEIHKSHWSVVRRFVCGILLNDGINSHDKITKIRNMKKKQEVLKRSLAGQLSKLSNKRQKYLLEKIEIFACLSESSDRDFIQSIVKQVELLGLNLTPNDMNVIASVLQSCKQVKLLQLERCGLNSELLKILYERLRSFILKISTLDVSQNNDLDFKLIGAIVRQCRVDGIVMSLCKLKPSNLKRLQEDLQGIKVETLVVSRNDGIGGNDGDGFQTLAQIVHDNAVKNLSLNLCSLKDEEIIKFRGSVGDAKLNLLDLSDNFALTERGWNAVGELIRQCQVQHVLLKVCHLNADTLRCLKQHLGNAQIRTLDVCDYLDYQVLGEIIEQCGVKDVFIRSSPFKLHDMRKLQKSLGNAKIERIDLSCINWINEDGTERNANEDDVASIRDLLNNCEVKEMVLKVTYRKNKDGRLAITEEQQEYLSMKTQTKLIFDGISSTEQWGLPAVKGMDNWE